MRRQFRSLSAKPICTDIDRIKRLARETDEENWHFRAFLKEIPENIVSQVRQTLTPDLQNVVDRFCETFPCCLDLPI